MVEERTVATQRAERAPRPAWYGDVARFAHADTRQAVWQLVNTLVPYAILWVLMIRTVQLRMPYILTLALSVLAAGLYMRIFIFFHDCGHGSFLPSSRWNTIVGYVCGVLTFTPLHDWAHAHAIHHATAGNLDRRGTGDVWTMTLDEYRAAPRRTRIAYRFFRHPLVLLGLGPIFVFLIRQRFPRPGFNKRDRASVIITDLALLGIVGLASLTIGLRTYLLIQGPMFLFAGAIGIWLFYVQHQYTNVYWARTEAWDPFKAGLEGSSYYKLPTPLRWISGNIGLHHIHHLHPRIPNYRLQPCQDQVPALQAVKPLTFWASLRSLSLRLYDEQQRKMVGFRAVG